MSDIVACPSCERKLRVRPELVGHPVKCPSCATVFRPEDTPPPPPPPAPPEPVGSESRRRDEDEEGRDEARPRKRRRERDDDYDDDYGYEDRPRRRRRRRDYEPHRATLVLVMGICGMCGIFWPITSLVAWILGSSDLRAMRAGTMDPEGESSTRIGWILGIVGTLLFVVVMLFLCGIISLAIVAG